MTARRAINSAFAPNGGFVLVCVLWVVAIMTVITLGFGRRALLEHTAARYSLDYVKAMHMARGATNRGIVELRNKAVYDFLRGAEGRTSYAQEWARPKNLLEAGEEGIQLYSEAGNEEFKDDVCAYAIQDEESRVALSAAPDEILDEVPGLSRSVIRKINYRRRGSREDNEPPQPFQTIEELRFMEGISDDDWYGEKNKPGLRDLLSCYGDGLINVNTASEEVLSCIPKVSAVAGAIVDYRKGEDGILCTEDDKDFANLEDLGAKLQISGAAMEAMKKYCKVSSQFFTITGTATRRQGRIRATCTATVVISSQNANIAKWREETIEP
jgi:type II secretory pathway component PulK